MSSQNHALVFGASGVTGWAVTNQLLHGYPTPSTFASITALTNRPLSKELAQWPEDERLQIFSGIDLLIKVGQDGLNEMLKAQVKGIENVTHVYFFSYVFNADPATEISTNVELLDRAVTAIETLCPNFQFLVLPIGTKVYGVHLLADFPFSESLPLSEAHPRIPEPYASQMFYYNQIDLLATKSKGKRWSFCDIRPDIVVGYVPNNNFYCLPQVLAIYLSLFANVEGKGATVPFPGNTKSWKSLSNDSSQDIIAKFSIWASLHPNTCGDGQGFNVADTVKPVTWELKWPIICEYFSLKGVAPLSLEEQQKAQIDPTCYTQNHLAEWEALEKKHDLQSGRVGNEKGVMGFWYFIMYQFDFDRQLDVTKSHKAWGDDAEEVDTSASWYTAFDRFRKAKVIP